jgi:plasmid maintenance system antidote protein VapI
MSELRFKRDTDQSTIRLSKHEGTSIREMIRDNCNCTIPQYAQHVGLAPPNFYAILSGDRNCTLTMLNKILSGIEAKAEISVELVVSIPEIGAIASNADFLEQEDAWEFEEMEGLEEENM